MRFKISRHTIFIIVFSILTTIYYRAQSQSHDYLKLGFSVKTYTHSNALKHIFDDYNKFHNDNDISTDKTLVLKQFLPVINVGGKLSDKFHEYDLMIYYNQFTSTGSGIGGGDTKYYEKLTISHGGIEGGYRFFLINQEYFRSGPGVALNLERYKARLFYTTDTSVAPIYPMKNYLLSGQFNYGISLGGPKFNLDINIFYQIPFWRIDLTNLNQELNYGFAYNYSDDQMAFGPLTLGFSVIFCFGLY